MSDSKVKFSDLTTKKARIAYIRNMLGTNYKWAIKGLQRIYEGQTDAEQAMGATTEDNGIGFTGADAEFLTSLHDQYVTRGFLTPPQVKCLFKQMPKYASQLERMATQN